MSSLTRTEIQRKLEQGCPTQICHLCQEYIHSFDFVNVSTALLKLATMSRQKYYFFFFDNATTIFVLTKFFLSFST